MIVRKIIRYRTNKDDVAFQFDSHENCQLTLSGTTCSIMGPKFGGIVEGEILPNLRTAYKDADYHLCLEVMALTNSLRRKYCWERWYVTFEGVEK